MALINDTDYDSPWIKELLENFRNNWDFATSLFSKSFLHETVLADRLNASKYETIRIERHGVDAGFFYCPNIPTEATVKVDMHTGQILGVEYSPEDENIANYDRAMKGV